MSTKRDLRIWLALPRSVGLELPVLAQADRAGMLRANRTYRNDNIITAISV